MFQRLNSLVRCAVANWRRVQLLRAIKDENAERVVCLLKCGASPNIKNSDGRTALLMSMNCQSPEIFRLLAEFGASFDPAANGAELFSRIILNWDHSWRQIASRHLDLQGAYGPAVFEMAYSALSTWRARSFGASLLLRFASLKYDFDVRSVLESHLPIIIDFSIRPHRRLVAILDRVGLFSRIRTENDESGLHVALSAGLDDLALRLLADGADVCAFPRNESGRPALLVAASFGREALYSRLFVDGSVSKNALDESLFKALYSRDDHALLEALRSGGDPSATHDGETALNCALKGGRERAASLLIAFGAAIDEVDSDGVPPLANAVRMNSVGLVRLLLWLGCQPKSAAPHPTHLSVPIIAAAHSSGHIIVDELVAAGADVNERSTSGETALTYASLFGNAPVISALAKAGADVSAQCDLGWNALHWAVHGERGDAMPLLLEIGVDFNARDVRHRTALECAMQRSKFELASKLRNLGACDLYSAKPEWKSLIERGKFDFFISYRKMLFCEAAESLASALQEAGCKIFLDVRSHELDELQQNDPFQPIPSDELRRVLYIATKSSFHTLFFESALEWEVDPLTQESRTKFSWTLFEQIHSTSWEVLKRMPNADEIERYVALAKEMRARFESNQSSSID